MNSLIYLQRELAQCQQEFFESFDLETGEQLTDTSEIEDKMVEFEKRIIEKRQSYAKLLYEGFEKDIKAKIRAEEEKNKRIKQELLDKIKSIKSALSKEGAFEVYDDKGKVCLYVRPDMTRKKQSVDISKLKDEEKVVNIKKIPYSLYKKILDRVDDEDMLTLMDCVEIMAGELPVGHPAINYAFEPTIKITKTKPKDWEPGSENGVANNAQPKIK